MRASLREALAVEHPSALERNGRRRPLAVLLLALAAASPGCTGEAALTDACSGPACGDAQVGDADRDSGPLVGDAPDPGDSTPAVGDAAAAPADADLDASPADADAGADGWLAHPDTTPLDDADVLPPDDADATPLDDTQDAQVTPDSQDAPDVQVTPDAPDGLDDPDAQEPTGAWDDPIPVTGFPFVHAGDTTFAGSAVDSYACAPAISEAGGEVVYALSVPPGAHLTVSVDDVSGDSVDVDVHVLTALDPSACVTRGDTTVSVSLAAGEAYVVVDTWSNAQGTPLPGPYLVSMRLQGDSTTCTTNPIACPATPPAPATIPPEPPGIGGCPAGMTRVDAFCIDRWEAALVDAATGAPWSPYAKPTGALRAVSVPSITPQAYISQNAATDACAAANKRLCTDSEWLRACQGPSATTWPFGPAKHPGFCNDARICHPAIQRFETTDSWIWSSLSDPCIAQLPWGLAPTGAYAACESAEGAFDMVGNLHEWTSDPAGTFRGGFYVDTAINGAGCTYVTKAHDVSHWDYSTGFRCCSDDVP